MSQHSLANSNVWMCVFIKNKIKNIHFIAFFFFFCTQTQSLFVTLVFLIPILCIIDFLYLYFCVAWSNWGSFSPFSFSFFTWLLYLLSEQSDSGCDDKKGVKVGLLVHDQSHLYCQTSFVLLYCKDSCNVLQLVQKSHRKKP